MTDVRQGLRLHHDAMHTERSAVDWIVRCVRVHDLRSRDDFFPDAPTIESCLTDLALPVWGLEGGGRFVARQAARAWVLERTMDGTPEPIIPFFNTRPPQATP